MRKQLVLVVDDEASIVRLLRATLEADGFGVATADRGPTALNIINTERPDLVVLDVMMPEMDGFETLRRIRSQSQVPRVPVIMLTARTGDIDKLQGFQSGADDYVTKPFNPDELLARITAVLRRSGGDSPATTNQMLRYPDLEIDLDQRRVLVRGEEIRLSRTEWALLSQLAGNPGRIMLHAELLTRIWGPEFRDEVHYLRTWVSRLRAKLEPDAGDESIISTFPGVGYRLEPPGGSPARQE
ncbi:MAG TPA: response regulator transcription factor [Thermomicrobiales bacterium]|nr:response regulator transcription factor [Thermomicrobiales bacterium]